MKKFVSLIIILSIISLNLSLTPRALAADIDDLIQLIVDKAGEIDQFDAEFDRNLNVYTANADEVSKITQDIRGLRVDIRRINRYGEEPGGPTKAEVEQRIRRLKVRSRALQLRNQQTLRATSILETETKKGVVSLRKLIKQLSDLRMGGGQGGAQFKIGQAVSKGTRALEKAGGILLKLKGLKVGVITTISRIGMILSVLEAYSSLLGIIVGLSELAYLLARCTILEQWNASRPATEQITRRWNERTTDFCKRLEDEFRRAIEWETALEERMIEEMPGGGYRIGRPPDWPPTRPTPLSPSMTTAPAAFR